jgi:hypothetical protein
MTNNLTRLLDGKIVIFKESERSVINRMAKRLCKLLASSARDLDSLLTSRDFDGMIPNNQQP